MSLRLGYLIFAALFVIVGLLMIGVPFGHSTFGVRTVETLRDTQTWHTVNRATGLLLIIWGWLCLCVFSYGAISVASILTSATCTVLIASSSAISGTAVHTLGQVIDKHGLFVVPPTSTLIYLVTAHLAFAVLGNCTLKLDTSVFPPWFGFRMPGGSARRVNRAGGVVLQLTSSLGLMAGISYGAAGNYFVSNAILTGSLLAIPLIAVGVVAIVQHAKRSAE